MKNLIEKWRISKDRNTGNLIIQKLRQFKSKQRRKEFVAELIFNMDYTNEELITLSNEIGRLSHERSRLEE